ncbi:hypothetical protein [Saccharothrix variisporea]|uniref:hypothetical protein n=1 Tax=Saccharothrix variisporea TaxID=543527 RepID=UPI000EABFE53|nr:hypothetical protein [Saccharothrix variisporea]
MAWLFFSSLSALQNASNRSRSCTRQVRALASALSRPATIRTTCAIFAVAWATTTGAAAPSVHASSMAQLTSAPARAASRSRMATRMPPDDLGHRQRDADDAVRAAGRALGDPGDALGLAQGHRAH